MPDKLKPEGLQKVADAVMKDKVTRAAIEHSGEEPSPSRVAASESAVKHAGRESASEVATSKARQSETRKRSKGQRETSMVWEMTQKDIALVLTRVTIVTAATAALVGKWIGLQASIQMAAFVFLYGVANLVIGFYFGRTNHQRVGGPGGDQAGTR